MRLNPFATCYVLRPAGDAFEILQLFRRTDAYMGETWQAVSGGIEEGETGWEAGLRELKEETGLDALRYYRLPSSYPFYVPQMDTLSVSICFCAIVAADAAVVLNHEHTDFRWIPLGEAGERFMWPSDHTAIGEIERYVLKDGLCSPYLPIAASTAQAATREPVNASGRS